MEKCDSVHKYNLIKEEKTVIFMQNSWTSSNTGMRENCVYHLTKFKREDHGWTVIYCAINHKNNLDFHDKYIHYLVHCK